jgi:hypothetical protein
MAHGSVRADIGGHTVSLTDDLGERPEEPHDFGHSRDEGQVSILIDGRMVAAPVRTPIRLNRRAADRYWGYVNLVRLRDREGAERIVVAQNIGGGRYRTTSVFADGTVQQDSFGYGEWCSPPVRAMLVREVVSVPIGYCSGVMQVWPSLSYPILYPWCSGFLGVAATVLGAAAWLRRRAAPGDGSVEPDT